jgi:hypothetical protein
MRGPCRMRQVISRLMATLALCCLATCGLQPAGAEPQPSHAESEIAFTRGLMAFQQGLDAEAAAELSLAVQLDPEAGTSRYLLGLTLLRMGKAKEAVAAIEASLRARHRPEVERSRLLADLRAARRAAREEAAGSTPGPAATTVAPPEWTLDSHAEDRGSWEGGVDFALGTDSNPNLQAADLVLPVPPGRPPAVVRGAQRDSVADLGLRLGWFPLRVRAGWEMGVELEAGQSLYRRFDFLNLGELRTVVQVARGLDPRGYLSGPLGSTRVPFGARSFSTLLQAGASAYQLNGSAYLRTAEAATVVSFPESPAATLRLDLAGARRSFTGRGLSDSRRSGHDLSLGLAQTFFLGGGGERSLELGGRVVDRQAGRPFAASILEGGAELTLPVAVRWRAWLRGAVRRDRFKYPESNLLVLFGPARRDVTTSAAAALSWVAADQLLLTARCTYGSRDSNVDLGTSLPDLGYRRLTLSLGGSWQWR